MRDEASDAGLWPAPGLTYGHVHVLAALRRRPTIAHGLLAHMTALSLLGGLALASVGAIRWGWISAQGGVRAPAQTAANNAGAKPATNIAATLVQPTGTYTDWYFPAVASGYKNLEWDLTVNRDPSPGHYFYSTQFWFNKDDGSVDPAGGYFGLQTRGSNPQGKIAIFSIWDATDSNGPEVSIPFGGEGEGRSVRITYPWVAGRTYHLRIAPINADGQWWGAWIKDTTTGVQSFVGQIKPAMARTQLHGTPVSFSENYVVTANTCSALEFSDASFANVAMNDRTVVSSRHRNHLADPVNCFGSYAVDAINGARQQMGNFGSSPPSVSQTATSNPTSIIQSCLFNGQAINPGPGRPTAELCRHHGISRTTFYKWKAQVRQDGHVSRQASEGAQGGEPSSQEASGREGDG